MLPGLQIAGAGRTGKAHGEQFANWPYNLFAMMHGRSLKDIRQVVDRFVREEKIRSFEVLETVEKLRK